MNESFQPRRAFTLVELLVSMAVLSLLLVLLVQLTNATQTTWASTVGKIEQFRDARQAFESVTRRLGQATLNTYWDYAFDQNGAPSLYIRQSELRFISGPTGALGLDQLSATGASYRPTHAVFFQAPLGLVTDTADYHGLDNLLNTWGYCIEFSADVTQPPFLASIPHPPPPRYRFRLLEMQEPSESFSLYGREVKAGGNASYKDKTWFSDPGNMYLPFGALPSGTTGMAGRPVHVLAENIVALILLPKLTKEDQARTTNGSTYTDYSLSPYYLYDSTSLSNNSPTSPCLTPTSDPELNPKNQLPAVVQVTMVAVDETSFHRLQGTQTAPPNFTVPAPPAAPTGNPPFQSGAQSAVYANDLATLQANLVSYHLNYRVFTTDVSIKAAKWSREKTQ